MYIDIILAFFIEEYKYFVNCTINLNETLRQFKLKCLLYIYNDF